MGVENDMNVINNVATSFDKNCDETTQEHSVSVKETTPESNENIPETMDTNNIISTFNVEIENDNGSNIQDTLKDSSILGSVTVPDPTNDSVPEDSPLNSKGGRKSNKQRILQYSDSEDENITKTDAVEVENANNSQSAPNRIDSDSDEENTTKNTIDRSSRKALKLIDSDSEDSEAPQASIYSTNSKGELIPENNTERNWRKLCDSESSDEESRNENECRSDIEEGVPKPIVYKRKKTKRNKEEPAAVKITAKEASKVRQEITRESQRMIRESNVSLPYHKPKSFSIKEFLSRRSKMASAVLPVINTHTPPSVAIKMSMDQLEAVTKNLKEREVEVKEFYKSESEDDDDGEDEDYVPPEKTEENDEKKETEEDSDEHCVPPEQTTNSNDEEKDDEKDIDETGQTEQNQQETLDQTDEVAQSNLKNTDEVPIQNESEVESNNEAVVNDETVNITENCTSEETTGLPENNQESLEYEFSLSDSEDQTESPQLPGNSFQYGELDKEIERFQTAEERRSKIELIKKKLGDSTPRLRGNPNEVINLETGVSRPSELTKFVERFMKHSEKKPVHKDKVKLNIISVQSGEIHEETIAMNVEDDSTSVIEEKPGVRLKKLRNELESQMAQMKSKLWQEKSIAKVETENTKEGYEEGEEIEDDILDDEEEEPLSEFSEEEDENEDDVEYKEKERKKSEFVDDEAEEDDEDEFEEIPNDASDEEQKDGEEDATEDETVDGADIAEENDGKAPKKLRRILKGFTEDSDDEENEAVSFEDSKNESSEGNKDGDVRISITEDSTNDDEGISVHQQTGQTVKTPLRTPNKSTSEFLTPISYITGLQNLNKSASKSLKDSPVSPFRIPNVPSPLRERNWQSSLQKKLFNDGEMTDSQIEDIAEICSENFTESQAVEENHITQDDIQEEPSQITCTQDLLNVCSGNFTLDSSDPTTQELLERPSNFTAKSQTWVERNENKELKSLEFEETNLISQLLDEEEMKNFKKRIESPSKATEEESDCRGGVIDSDDDGDGENLEVKVKRKKTKLEFSDEESSDDEDESPGTDEEINLHDEDDNENEETTDLSPENVDYDSEENEVVLDNNLAAKLNLKATDFFEDEAELSESDWDSADEDEKGMDAMEAEQGDAEKYDENEIRRDLEKIHMRRLLDDDTKEVKLLQELYLEDGEFHGTGRERKFRWRNIDSFNDDEGGDKKPEDDEYLDGEEETEEQWRKRRHEREMFLMEQKKKRREVDGDESEGDDELLSDSQLLKLGRKLVRKSLSGSSTEKVKSVEEKVDYKSMFTLVNRRGSFLSRGEQVLQRVATYTKETTTSVSVAKTSRNFLFQTISSEETTITTSDRKRRAEDATPKKIKKLRLSENFSPANRKPGR